MALNIQVQPRGDQYLFQGISSAGQGIGQGIQQLTANLKKAKAYRTMAVDALGMEPEDVDKMGLGELEGHFQAVAVKNAMAQSQAMVQEHQARMEELKAQADERRQKMQLSGDEAEAWPQLMQSIMEGRQGPAPDANSADPNANPMAPGQSGAPGPEAMMGAPGGAPTTGTTPPGQFSPQELMAGMARMGKTSPRLSAALSRVLLPRMMEGTTTGPTPWKSPEGNPYVWMGHTLMPDRPGLDVNAIMNGGQTPEGFTAVPSGNNKVQYLKTEKTLPGTFHETMDKIGEDIASANATLQQPDSAFVDANGKPQSADYIKTMRGYAQKRLGLAQQRGKGTIDRYRTTGYLNDEQQGEMYGELGLEAAKAKTAAPAAAAKGEEALALPKTQAELQKGKKYQTAKGIATWNGTKFVSD